VVDLAGSVNSSRCIEAVRDLQRRLRPYASVSEVQQFSARAHAGNTDQVLHTVTGLGDHHREGAARNNLGSALAEVGRFAEVISHCVWLYHRYCSGQALVWMISTKSCG
jgi:hypothetical protein